MEILSHASLSFRVCGDDFSCQLQTLNEHHDYSRSCGKVNKASASLSRLHLISYNLGYPGMRPAGTRMCSTVCFSRGDHDVEN